MKVLVTGANGQLGYDVLNLLKNQNIEYIGVDIDDFSSPFTGDNEKELSITLPAEGYYKGEVLTSLFVGYAGDPVQIYKDLSDKIKIRLYVGESRLGFVSSCNLRTVNIDSSTGFIRGPIIIVNNKDTSLPVDFFIEGVPILTVQFNIDYSTTDSSRVLFEMVFRGQYKTIRS